MEKGYEHTTLQDIIDNLGGLTRGHLPPLQGKEEILPIAADSVVQPLGPMKSLGTTGSTSTTRRFRARPQRRRPAWATTTRRARHAECFEAAADRADQAQALTK